MKKFLKNKFIGYTNLMPNRITFVITAKFYYLLNKQFLLLLDSVNFYNFLKVYVLKTLLFFDTKVFFFYTYFILNFSRLQEFFSFVFFTFKLFKAFSCGFLLRVFSSMEKKNRRLVRKHVPLLVFLKIFFFKMLSYGSEIWFYNFKKKYTSVVYDVSSWVVDQNITWMFRKSFGVYKFRRVKAIKKRIRRSFLKK